MYSFGIIRKKKRKPELSVGLTCTWPMVAGYKPFPAADFWTESNSCFPANETGREWWGRGHGQGKGYSVFIQVSDNRIELTKNIVLLIVLILCVITRNDYNNIVCICLVN